MNTYHFLTPRGGLDSGERLDFFRHFRGLFVRANYYIFVVYFVVLQLCDSLEPMGRGVASFFRDSFRGNGLGECSFRLFYLGEDFADSKVYEFVHGGVRGGRIVTVCVLGGPKAIVSYGVRYFLVFYRGP